MVKVATGVKGPIKFVFPKKLPAPTEYTREYFSMLGLGDVVVPGFFIAFLLAFDAHNARKEGKNTAESADWSKPYFHAGCVFYALALLVTVFVMIAFKHAQVVSMRMVQNSLLYCTLFRLASLPHLELLLQKAKCESCGITRKRRFQQSIQRNKINGFIFLLKRINSRPKIVN